MTRNRSRIALAVTGMAFGFGVAGVTVPMESGPIVGGGISWTLLGTAAIPAQGASPSGTSLCAAQPPAELLALAVWPLDPGVECGVSPPGKAVAEVLVEASAQQPVRRNRTRLAAARSTSIGERADQEVFVRESAGVGPIEVPVIERSWVRRGDSVAEGQVLVRAVPEPERPLVLAQVEERGWTRDASGPAVVACGSDRSVQGRCVVHREEGRQLAVDTGDAHGDEGFEAYPDDGPLVIAGARTVEEERMDGLRGGFVTPHGLMVSFGIERVVYVNGVLSSTTTLNVTELGKIVGGAADVSKMVPLGTTVGLIQNGPNNTFVGDVVSSGAIATVIQNSLDNQQIQTVTTINTQVNSLEMMRATRFGESLRDAAVIFR